MKRDVSKETVVVLLLLTVVVALIGTVSVTKQASEISFAKNEFAEPKSQATGFAISEVAKPQFGKASITFIESGDEIR